jgi:DNA-binding transcriptional regulator YiaG
MVDDVDRPIDVMRLLAERGLGLRRAHAVFQRIARGEEVAVEVRCENSTAVLTSAFEALGVEARELRIPNVSSRDVRTRLNLSQKDFALRFGFEVDTVQNWDQGRNQPDVATKLLLAIIDRDPAIVDAVLSDQPRKSS